MMASLITLCPRLAQVLDAVRVDANCRRAWVEERELVAASTRELRHRLSDALYETFHAGYRADDGPPPRTTRDILLENRFKAAMPHVHTITRAPLTATGDSGMTVELDGLRVRLDPSTPGPDTDHGIGALVNIAVDATYPTLSPGFFLAKGSRGQPRHGELIRLYIHLESADAAVAAWSTTIGHLEQQRLPYQAKVLSNPQLYPRHDSLVVYLGPEALRDVHTLTEKITTIGGLGEPTSLFAEQLAPGISIAWEPRDSRPGMAGLSFGQHRATAIAEGIVRHAENQHPELNPADTVTAALLQAGINPANPARNIT